MHSWAQGQSFPSSPGKPGLLERGLISRRAVVGQWGSWPRVLSLNTHIFVALSPQCWVSSTREGVSSPSSPRGEMPPVRPGLRVLPSYHARVDTILAPFVSME